MRPGVRTRVVGAFAAVMLFTLAVAGFAIRSGVDDQLVDATDGELETRAAAVARLLAERGGPAPGLTEGLDDPGESFTQLVDSRERVVLATPGLPPAPLLDPDGRRGAAEGTTVRLRGVAVEPDEGDEEIDLEALEESDEEAFEDDRARIVARSVTVGGERYAVLAGATLEDREDALAALTGVLAIALPLALLASCLAGWLAVGAALRPVERMRRRAAGISERSVDERLPLPEADDELRRLGETLNGMLERLGAALERERGLVSDASHELRTPLALLQAELELALRTEQPEPALRAAIASALEETVHLTALTEDLLLLSRSDHGQGGPARVPVPLRALAEKVAGRLGPDAGVEVRVAAGLEVGGDPAQLERALANLVDNALRHGARPVEVDARQAGDRVTITVADRGAGVPEAFLPRAFERFSRGDAARSTPGTGLGLSIVAAVAAGHGGEVRLRSRDGGGTEAVLELPA